jgi:hypothetical protein
MGEQLLMALTDAISAIGGLTLRLRADQITGLSSGANVAAWPDASGNTFNATQATTATQPTWQATAIGGQPGVVFNGHRLVSSAPAGGATQTLIAVVSWSAASGVASIRAADTNGGLQWRILSGKQNLLAQGVADLGSATTALTAGTPALVATTYDAATGSAWYLNGVADGTSLTHTALTTSGSFIGGKSDGNEYLVGTIAELLTWNRVLTTSELSSVNTYVSGRYGIAVAGGGAPDTTAPTVPGTPTAAAGNASATVTFAASTDAVGVTGYRVYSSADSYTATAATGGTSPITVAGLTNGTAYTFKVAAVDAAGNLSAQSAASNSITPSSGVQTLTNTVTPTITGSGVVGQTLSATTGTWSATPDSYTYQWNRAGVAISGATAATYALVSADGGTTVTCTVTAVKAGYASATVTTAGIAVAAPGTVLPSDTNIVYSPYNWDVTSVRAKTINPGAYFRFAVTATAITLNFEIASNTAPLPIIKYRIDGSGWTKATVAATIPLTIPTDNGWAKHAVEVVVASTSEFVTRWSPQNGYVAFTGLTVNSGAATFPTATRAVKVLIYGDSITEGFKSTQNVTTPDGSDATVTWSYLVGSELGAEVGVVGFGAQGWTNGGQGGVPALISSYNLLWAGQARSFTPTPDVVVVNMGQNQDPAVSTVTTWLTALLASVGSTTKVILMRPFSGAAAATMQSAVATFANSRVTYLDTTGWWNAVDASDGVHPYGYSSVTQLAPLTAAAIRSVIGGSTFTPKRFINVGGTAKPIS